MNDIVPKNIMMCIEYLKSVDGFSQNEETQFYYCKKNNKEFLFVLFEDCYSEDFKIKNEKLLGGKWKERQHNEEYLSHFNVHVIFSCIFELFDNVRTYMYDWQEKTPNLSQLREQASKLIRIPIS